MQYKTQCAIWSMDTNFAMMNRKSLSSLSFMQNAHRIRPLVSTSMRFNAVNSIANITHTHRDLRRFFHSNISHYRNCLHSYKTVTTVILCYVTSREHCVMDLRCGCCCSIVDCWAPARWRVFIFSDRVQWARRSGNNGQCFEMLLRR